MEELGDTEVEAEVVEEEAVEAEVQYPGLGEREDGFHHQDQEQFLGANQLIQAGHQELLFLGLVKALNATGKVQIMAPSTHIKGTKNRYPRKN